MGILATHHFPSWVLQKWGHNQKWLHSKCCLGHAEMGYITCVTLGVHKVHMASKEATLHLPSCRRAWVNCLYNAHRLAPPPPPKWGQNQRWLHNPFQLSNKSVNVFKGHMWAHSLHSRCRLGGLKAGKESKVARS